MQKLVKKCLIEGYEKWYSENPSRKYNSSNGKYYYEVVRNLFLIQRGVCAYTERFLCSAKQYEPFIEKQENQRLEFDGNLEHFDVKFRKTNGWLWSNFLMAHSDTNRRKNDDTIDYILKPDTPDYDPFYLLDYNVEKHLFFANTQNLTKEEQERVNHMIILLGINYDTVVTERKEFFQRKIKKIELGLANWEEYEEHLDRFFTSFTFCKNQLPTP